MKEFTVTLVSSDVLDIRIKLRASGEDASADPNTASASMRNDLSRDSECDHYNRVPSRDRDYELDDGKDDEDDDNEIEDDDSPSI